jgi:hypothetical protein
MARLKAMKPEFLKAMSSVFPIDIAGEDPTGHLRK